MAATEGTATQVRDLAMVMRMLSGLRPSRVASANTERSTGGRGRVVGESGPADGVTGAVGPVPDVQDGTAGQGRGVQQRGQRERGLVLPEGHVPVAAGARADQRVGPGERLGRVLAPRHRVPPEGGRDAADTERVEHVDHATAPPGASGVGEQVRAGGGGDDRAGPVQYPVRQRAGLALAGRGQQQPVGLHRAEHALTPLGPAQADGVVPGPGQETLAVGQAGAGPAASLGGGQAAPLVNQLGHGGEPRAGAEAAPGAPAHGPGAVGFHRPVGQVEPPEQRGQDQDGEGVQVQVVKRQGKQYVRGFHLPSSLRPEAMTAPA